MDHVALDRPGPDDRHFDHQVVEAPRLQPRQHAHLRPALDLEHAHRVGPADHGVDVRVALGDVGQRELPAVVPLDQVEALADGREHAQGQAIDLEDAQLVEVVLVPLDDGAVGHGGVFDGHQFAQRPARHDHAAGVLREMPRKADQLADQLDQLPARRSTSGSMPASRHRCGQVGLVVEMLQPLGQRVDPLERQAQGLAHVAHRRARAVGDHLGGHAGPLAAVLLVEILQHLLAPLVLEIDVDVGGFVPLAADEPLEEHVHPLGIDRRDAQAVADGRIGRRAASLAEDAAAAGRTAPGPRPSENRPRSAARSISCSSCSTSRRTLLGHAAADNARRPRPR